MTTGFLVRRAEAADVAGLVRMESETAGMPRWGEARYRDMVDGSASDEFQRVLLVAVDGERLVGFVAGSVVLDDADLEGVVVDAEYRRRGVGAMLCGAWLTWSREMGATHARLEVREGNKAAQELYKRLGFCVDGVRRGYYSAPVEDAVAMSVRLD